MSITPRITIRPAKHKSMDHCPRKSDLPPRYSRPLNKMHPKPNRTPPYQGAGCCFDQIERSRAPINSADRLCDQVFKAKINGQVKSQGRQ